MTQTMTENILTYNGKLTFDIINNLLVDYNQQAKCVGINTVVTKRIYAILVEGLENSLRHQCEACNEPQYDQITLAVFKDGELIKIQIGNYINNQNIDSITDKIELINSLDLVGLNRLYRASISKARISEKGGAGLGLIEIARNSRYSLQYEMKKEQNGISFFKFFITISNNPNKAQTI